MSGQSVEIPRSLKHLVQRVMRGFYPIEHVIVVDLLIRRRLVKEDDMIDLLKFERKQLRSVLAMLEKDKLTKKKLRIETGLDGKSTKQHYYYINYKALVNVVKYKLDHMRKKIELEERDLTARASFVCDECHKTFTDLEVDQLLDPMTADMRCSFCGGEVKEDPNHMPKADSRLLLAKFNQMMEPLWLLLKDVEDIRLTSDLLEPEIQVSAASGLKTEPNSNAFTGKQWTDKNRAINSSYESAVLNDHKNFSIKIEDSADEVDGAGANRDVQVKKEAPAWMTESTVSNMSHITNNKVAVGDGFSQNASQHKTNHKYMSKANSIQSTNSDSNEPSKEILETLLIHEKQQDNSASAAALLLSDTTNHISHHSSTNNHDNEDELMSEDEEEDAVEQPMVTVGSQSVPLNEVNDQIISQMSEEEKEHYIRLTQQFYAHMYDI